MSLVRYAPGLLGRLCRFGWWPLFKSLMPSNASLLIESFDCTFSYLDPRTFVLEGKVITPRSRSNGSGL